MSKLVFVFVLNRIKIAQKSIKVIISIDYGYRGSKFKLSSELIKKGLSQRKSGTKRNP
jgi:hypothetical protein